MRSDWIPERPRLADAVAVRRHVVAGDEKVILHGPPPASGVACIGEREWAFIACADGTRDLAGIRLASGRRCTDAHLVALFEQLAGAGMLEDGPSEPEADPEARPIPDAVVGLPGFELRCDGSGTCCRLYPTTTFLPLDVARARSACPDVLDGGHHPERVFTPIASSSAPSWEARAVAMVDGRCAYLDGDGSCRIHVVAGASQKPNGCRSFPMRFVSDGEAVVVAPAPECRCVFTSPRVNGAAAIVRPGDASVIEHVGDDVRVDEATSWSRDTYLSWARRTASLLEDETDGVTALWDLAEALSPSRVPITHWVDRLRERVERHVEKHTWRSATDLAKKIPDWITAACNEEEGAPLAGENLYLRSIAHVHAWVLDGVPLATSLRERAVRLHVARRLTTDDPDPAVSEPIALVEACCRAFSLHAAT